MKIKLSLLFIFVCAFSYAQYTVIPDANFENALSAYDDIPNDGQVPTANINTVTYLSVVGQNINDLTGIEDFTSLESLICYSNNLTTINISQNQQLTWLNCRLNNITTIDFSLNPALITLQLSYNNFINIDLSSNSNLTTISCHDNDLIGLHVANGNNTIITGWLSYNNPNLNCIQVDDVAYSTTNWTNIDTASSFSINCHFNETYVPDNNFENYLETHNSNGVTVAVGNPTSMGNGIANDDYVTTTNINTINTLNIVSLNITDLTGIEDFNGLVWLEVYGNNVSSVDLSQTNIIQVGFNLNPLSQINLPISLHSFSCYNCQLTDLDLSLNINLTDLYCVFNPQLTSLNLKNGNNINMTQMNATSCPNLTCIEVDDVAWSTANWTNISSNTGFGTNCTNPETYVPDDNFENYLETHNANGAVVTVGDLTSMGNGIANDDYVTTSSIDTVIDLFVSLLNISDLTGIEDFVALDRLICPNNILGTIDLSQNLNLTILNCRNTGLSTIDLSSNTNLVNLNCSNNQLTNLDVSSNLALISLYANYNQITSVDVSANTLLTLFQCHDNQLISLNVKNSNNINFTSFLAINNSNLACIIVDDSTWSDTNWSSFKDTTSTFVNNQTACNALSVEDEILANLSIYPSPTKNKLTIEMEVIANYDIFSINGRLLKKGKLEQGENKIVISELTQGIYVLKIHSNNKTITRKIIKQ